MASEYGKLAGPLVLTQDLELFGAIEGDCKVPAGRRLDLYGVVAGDLHVDEGGSAAIRGVVGGSVHADGPVEISGVVVGLVTGDRVTIRAGSIVGDRRVEGQHGPTADYGDG